MANALKRLELNGFKSFAQRTVLEFPSGITAIVGPNGSGKSNIVDAMRWLLGEREAKNLRGGKVEDLIFAGTPKRARLGQAQASLHFDNSAKFFPIEFAEVTVLREVRRDGASRYFLNKSEVLLRDLVDFFAKARLGSRGFIVVTQGNSDMFIQATPTERREMIEEVLGLREYQLKRLDAERRLRNSDINIEKVRALVEEILPHLRSLKRQTGRWERRGAMEEELKHLEDQFFGKAWQDLRKRIGEADGEIERHKQTAEVLRKKRESAEAHEREVEASQPKGRKEAREIREATQALLERRGALQKNLGKLEAQRELRRSEAVRVPASTEKVLELVRRIRRDLEAAVAGDAAGLMEAVKRAMKDIDLVLQGGEGHYEPPRDLQAEFEKVRNEMKKLDAEMAALAEREGTLEKSGEEFYKTFKAAVAAVEAAKDAIEKWEVEHQKRLFEKERLEIKLQELEHQVAQAGRKPEEFRGVTLDPALANEDPALLERRIFKLRGDLASIGEVDESLMKEARETEERYEFLKRESDDLERAKDDLAKLIGDLNERIRTEFSAALVKINEEFRKFFTLMFGGGHARLKLVMPERRAEKDEELPEEESEKPEAESEEEEEEEKEVEGGIEMDLKLPRKKLSSLEVLSGGERSLVGIAALFAMISVSPPPFLVLDEIDAALDDRNARRFAEMLKEFSKRTQFIVVTHNRATMEAADVLYGVTLNDDGTSKLVSMKLEGTSVPSLTS